MAIQLGQEAPDLEADTTGGPISFREWIGDSCAALRSHPSHCQTLLSASTASTF